jgi:hypothetical protein
MSNRHERRRAKAMQRRTGYMHRLLAAHAGGAIPTTPGVFITTVEHDPGCSIYQGTDCNCVPDISVSGPDDTVTTIDENGDGTKVRRS